MTSESFKKRQQELAKLGAQNEEAGKIVTSPTFLDYRDGYRMLAGISLYISMFTLLFMVSAFVFFVYADAQQMYATTTHGEVYEVFPVKITN